LPPPVRGPAAGDAIAGLATDAGEGILQDVNRWIRTSQPFDAVINFDAALRDPAYPGRLRRRRFDASIFRR
jgi:hypothetical protein